MTFTCYGCGKQHTSDVTGNRDGQPKCLGFCRDEVTAMEALGMALSGMGCETTVIGPGVVAVKKNERRRS